MSSPPLKNRTRRVQYTNMVLHTVTHYSQPTNHSCAQAALATLLSHFGETFRPLQLCELVPVCKNEHDEDAGSITQHLALWCRKNGYNVQLYTSDFELIDLSWRSLSKNNLLTRMEAAKSIKTNPVLGRHFSQEYLQSYIDFIQADGEVNILPHMSGALISSLLRTSPIIACVNYNVLHSVGRQIYTGQNTSKTDDIGGKLSNHFVVLYGEDAQGNFLFTDSWMTPGRFVIEREKLICAITAAQIECDSIIFQIAKSDKE